MLRPRVGVVVEVALVGEAVAVADDQWRQVGRWGLRVDDVAADGSGGIGRLAERVASVAALAERVARSVGGIRHGYVLPEKLGMDLPSIILSYNRF